MSKKKLNFIRRWLGTIRMRVLSRLGSGSDFFLEDRIRVKTTLILQIMLNFSSHYKNYLFDSCIFFCILRIKMHRWCVLKTKFVRYSCKFLFLMLAFFIFSLIWVPYLMLQWYLCNMVAQNMLRTYEVKQVFSEKI